MNINSNVKHLNYRQIQPITLRGREPLSFAKHTPAIETLHIGGGATLHTIAGVNALRCSHLQRLAKQVLAAQEVLKGPTCRFVFTGVGHDDRFGPV